jgi:hypothetical protein
MWNYVFFVAFLQEKAKTDYNGIENFVSEKLAMQDISWAPLLKYPPRCRPVL